MTPAAAPSDGTGQWRIRRPGVGITAAAILVLVVVVFPLVITGQVSTQIGVDAMLFVAASVAWNIFSGYSGYISLGHAVFFGSGAYFVGVAAQDWNVTGDTEFALIPLAGLVAGVIAVPFGLIALRVRRHTFVVVTIAVFFIFQLMAFNLSVTGGSVGIPAPFLSWAPETYNDPFYYLALIVAVGATALSWLIRGSRFGLQLRAIRDDEDRARGLGVRTMQVKLTAFVISAVLTGLVGGIWFLFIQQVVPQYGFDPLFDLSVALMAFLGGLGTIWGPVIGALILEPGQQILTLRSSNSYLSEIIWGALFILVILFLPRGIIPVAQEKARSWRAMRARSREPATGQGTGAQPVQPRAAQLPAGQPASTAGESGTQSQGGTR